MKKILSCWAVALGVFAGLVATSTPARAQTVCSCATRSNFGSCISTRDANYPSDFPACAVAVRRETGPTDLFVADLFTGFTFRYSAQSLTPGVQQTLISPRGSAATKGLVHLPADPAVEGSTARLIWLIGNQLISTPLPSLTATDFGRGTVLGTVDVEGLAAALFQDASRAGEVSGLAYHPNRNNGAGTLWTIDIENDIYFEIEMDGSLRLGNDGMPVQFPSPITTPGGAFGNAITYVSTPNGEFFDILVGEAREGRATRVTRVHAPTDGAAGPAIGASAGLGYELGPVLGNTLAASGFPLGLAYFGNSCVEGQSSEYLLVFDPLGQDAAVIEVSVDEPAFAGVAGLSARAQGSAVTLSWTNTRGYDSIRIVRSTLTSDDAADQNVELTRLEGIDLVNAPGEAPTSYLDVAFVPTADGTYRYTVTTDDPSSAIVPGSSVVVTVGRGRVTSSFAFEAIGDATRFPPSPGGMTATDEHLIVIDRTTGTARRFLLTDSSADGTIASPFVSVGQTSGIAYVPATMRLEWLGRVGGAYFLQSTDLDGMDVQSRRRVQSPVSNLTAVYGDIAHDAAGDRFWLVDRANVLLHAVGPDGVLAADSTIRNPAGAMVLGTAIDVSASAAGSVTLDFAYGRATVVDRIARVRYQRADLAAETQHILHLPSDTQSNDPSGIFTRNGTQYIAGGDTARIYAATLAAATGGGTPFRRGDANNDGRHNISDASFVLSFLFRGDAVMPACLDALDSNDNGTIEISDAVLLFNFLFRGGVEIDAPFPDCGFDVSDSNLTCENSICVP